MSLRRALLSLAVIAGAAAVARAPLIHPFAGSSALANAHEVKAYRLGAPAQRFPLAPGQKVLRILTNLDLGKAIPAEGLPYAVRIRIPEEDRDELFGLMAVPATALDGSPAAFYLGEAESPALTREVAIQREGTKAATLEVSLEAPAGGTASLRVLTLQDRPPLVEEVFLGRLGPAEQTHLADRVGVLDYSELAAEQRAELIGRRWSRLAAAPGAQTRRLYLKGSPAPRPRKERPVGDEVAPGQLLAYSVRGPGTLRLSLVEGEAAGEVELLTESGQASRRPMANRVDLPVVAGLTTARVKLPKGARVLARVSDPAMALGSSRPRVEEGGEAQISPAWSLERDPLADEPAAEPVLYDLTGRSGAELRLTARALVSPGDASPALAVTWKMLGATGAVLASGRISGPAILQPEDRIDEKPGQLLAEGVAQYLWPVPGAASLQLTAERPTAVGVSSPGFEPPLPARSATRQVHLPQQKPSWFRIRPANEEALESQGRMVRLRLAGRLVPEPALPPAPADAESLEPVGSPPRLLLVTNGRPGAPPPAHGALWSIPTGEAAFEIKLAPGTADSARWSPHLVYAGPASIAQGQAIVSVDGAVAVQAPLFTARGALNLPPLPSGKHRLKAQLGEGARAFLDAPVEGGSLFRSTSVFELEPGAATRIKLHKGEGPRSLGAVFYFDQRPGPGTQLIAKVDGGSRGAVAPRQSRLRTRIRREVPLTAERAPGAFYLNRTSAEVWATPAVFVGLGDDLAAGDHEIDLELKGTAGRAFARFFAYGGPPPVERVVGVGQARSAFP